MAEKRPYRLVRFAIGKLKVPPIVLAGALSVVTGMGIPGAIESYHRGVRPVNAVSIARATSAVQGLPDFATLAKNPGPTVVHMSTTAARKADQERPSLGDDQIG